MTPTFRRFALVLVLALVAGTRLTADPPPASGRALLLANGLVIEGEITRIDDQYRIVRDGGTTWLPADRSAVLCADLSGAYQVLRGRTDARNPDARLRLARWCERMGLREQAVAEVRVALAIRPHHVDAQRFLKHLQSPATIVQAAATAPAPPPPAVPEPPPVEVGAEALKRFVTKVQPVLMNACATCHAAPTATAFRLQRVYADGLNNRPATHANLAATAAHVDRAHPARSKLLTMATTAHGGGTIPPLRDRSVPAFRQLDEWAAMMAPDAAPTPATAPPPADAEVGTESANAPPAPAKEQPADKPDDPFDPAIFNRQHHPEPPKPAEPPSPPKP
jgi:hypothetical protein